jgi:hypothetical protein
MKRFVVNSDVPVEALDVPAWVMGVAKMLSDAKIANVKFNTAYCCTPERKVIAEFEGPDKETVNSALKKLSMPFTLVMEATKIEG